MINLPLNLSRSLVKFEIVLTSPSPLLIYGPATQAESATLSGVLRLEINEPIEIKQVHLKLRGKARVSWMEGYVASATQRTCQDKLTFFIKRWDFLPFTDNSIHSLPKGIHEWPFSVILPGDMPETIYCQDGAVDWKLSALVERPALQVNYRTKRLLTVVRSLPDIALELTQTVSVNGELQDKFEYKVSIPQRAHNIGDCIPVTLSLTPLVKNLHLHSLKCVLNEHTTVNTRPCSGIASRQTSRIIKSLRTTDFKRINQNLISMAVQQSVDRNFIPSESNTLSDNQSLVNEESPSVWTLTGNIQIPSKSYLCNPTFKSPVIPLINVKHKLFLSIQILNSNGTVSDLSVNIPVMIFLDRFVSLSRHSSDPDASMNLVDDGDLVTGHITDNLPPMPLPPYSGHSNDPLGGPSILSPMIHMNDLPPLPPSAPTSPYLTATHEPSSSSSRRPSSRPQSFLGLRLGEALYRPSPAQTEETNRDDDLSRVPPYDAVMAQPEFLPPFSTSLPNYDDVGDQDAVRTGRERLH